MNCGGMYVGTNTSLILPKDLLAVLLPMVKEMILKVVVECGATVPTSQFSLPGGCDTGGWLHLSDIRRSRTSITNGLSTARTSTTSSKRLQGSQCN